MSIAPIFGETVLTGIFSGPICGLKYASPSRSGFTNERGEFFISTHPSHDRIEITETPEMVRATYESSKGSDFLVALYDPDTSEMGLSYPNGIKDYRHYALMAANQIIAARITAKNIKTPLK